MSSTLVIKVDQSPVRFFYNLASKQKKTAGSPLDLLHRSNCDEQEPRLIQKEKWPIPSGNFTCDKRLFFKSTYPDFTIGDEIEIDLMRC